MEGGRAKRQKIDKTNKFAAFQKLKDLKGQGVKHKYEFTADENVYEEVSEKEYTERVLKRQEDDWIDDDGGDGYVEDGREIFDDDIEDVPQKKEKHDKRKKNKNIQNPNAKGDIQKLLANMPVKKKKKEEVQLNNDDVLADLLSEVNTTIAPTLKLNTKTNEIVIPKEEPPAPTAKEYLANFSKPIKALGSKYMREFERIEEKVDVTNVESVSSAVELSTSPPPPPQVVEKKEHKCAEWEAIQTEPSTSEPQVHSRIAKRRKTSRTADDSLPLATDHENKKVFRMFFLDAFEDIYKQPGTVYLFGKVFVKENNSHSSCCVIVQNIDRKIYLLPRSEHLKTKEPVSIAQVYSEFDQIATQYKILDFKSRKIEKKYAFNLPGVPDLSEYLEVRYSAKCPALPSDLSGDTFSHVFGTKTSFLENLLLERKIKGPSWLEFPEAEKFPSRISWCKYEVQCNQMEKIRVSQVEGLTPPPLVIASINVFNFYLLSLIYLIGIVEFIKFTMLHSSYIIKIMCELNVLPLAIQITNVCGNVLSRTLMGGRSERNEFLLLHAFHEKSYVLPDKQYGKNKKEGEETGEANKGKGRKKAAYSGGLVLEPKKGFYDKFIILMDFNSLYPSIIQEYNICFTTIPVRMLQDSDITTLCEYLPEHQVDTGILPSEIKKLVESRRQVKALMKQPNLSSDLLMQYDIRQKALKLTANSMYGCLGFPNSRFFAQPLAALVTAKGREILLNTKSLVENLNYEVIYGDTDSLMISCNVNDYDSVFKIGNQIKSECNKLYKQLELDIDGVYKYMLLLKKKKYAALSISKLSNGKMICSQEIKGVDVVRRDWSQLASEAGKFVISQILDEQSYTDYSLDDRLQNIHEHMKKIRTDLDNGFVPLTLLEITKQLTKAPEGGKVCITQIRLSRSTPCLK
ncbi:DNA polymerase alpha catalytic subunit-like [Diaphorina citri]|uniref:DNA polymerase n=1 Tax=Diaphorina citri TaxID=121845 RepID=A0A3Q0IZN4_DIACI|nr:DNA polymerase alpha catalytic subunit-like [Diaphorina citri]